MTDAKEKKLRGFAGMSPEKRREVARQGGKSVDDAKRAFSLDPALAARAGRKGGQNLHAKQRSFSKDPELASRAAKARKAKNNG